ncbi:hypothetical protein M3936_12615 [Sutcliffiella horikoshii]|uniref:hypothetical protein n=1 Tax=Sutcliffiella horikoshii TaxID=79883 RepID=UPI00203B23D4|nr:hypothetical protein [Sutcliffiella horikoshii]MCM3618425.1 hypothetical protein [Sutcliffiella horikoshii]
MLKRKIATAILTFIISTIIIASLSPVELLLNDSHNVTGTYFQDIMFISVYVGGGILLFGLPVSILIELITQKLKEARFALSFPLHILFGIIPVFVLGFLVIFSLLVSIVFLLIDELIRYGRVNQLNRSDCNKVVRSFTTTLENRTRQKQ